MRPFLMLSLALTVANGLAKTGLAAEKRPNVLFIAADDLNDWVGCLAGHPQVKTPHIDRLARRGTLFTNAHCQAPLCNPSRSSLLTGLRPTTTGIYALEPGIRTVASLKNHVTLPQHFSAQGYFTATSGKVFHDGSIAPADRTREFQVWGDDDRDAVSAREIRAHPRRHRGDGLGCLSRARRGPRGLEDRRLGHRPVEASCRRTGRSSSRSAFGCRTSRASRPRSGSTCTRSSRSCCRK